MVRALRVQNRSRYALRVRGVLGALIGVPATILVAGGLGLIGVTLFSRLVSRSGREPIRWAHLALGVFLLVVGAGLLDLEVVLFGAG